MPYGDRTGPEGKGPRTGRAMGFCAGYDRPGSCTGGGRGMGRGRGFGFGRGRFMQPAQPAQPVELSKAEEAKILEAQKAGIKQELSSIEKRLKALKK